MGRSVPRVVWHIDDRCRRGVGSRGLGLAGGGYGDVGWIEEQFRGGRVTPRSAASGGALSPQREPRPLAPAVRTRECRCSVNSRGARDAAQALEAGADVIVAQGAEAGGHGDRRATLHARARGRRRIGHRSPDTLLRAGGSVPTDAGTRILSLVCWRRSRWTSSSWRARRSTLMTTRRMTTCTNVVPICREAPTHHKKGKHVGTGDLPLLELHGAVVVQAVGVRVPSLPPL